MFFMQFFGLSLIIGTGMLLAICAGYLPVVISWRWYRRGYSPLVSTVLCILDDNVIHNWLGSLSVAFWVTVSFYLSVAFLGACAFWLAQWASGIM